jgi:hypothetical protein
MKWIKNIHTELTDNLKDWVKPFMWVPTMIIALLCILVGSVLLPIIVLVHFLDKYTFTPIHKAVIKLFYKDTPDEQ